MVVQDATDSLDLHLPAFASIAAPGRTLFRLDRAVTRTRVIEAAGLAGLPAELPDRYPHQVSGGQKARVGIVRALAPGPSLQVLHEPTSALDVLVQAVVLRLFDDIRLTLGTALLFISRDLGVVRLLCSRVVVMLLGRVVESGPSAELFDAPAHPCPRALFHSVPDPARRGRPAPTEHDQSTVLTPEACRFAGRCPLVQSISWTDRSICVPWACAG